MALPASVRYPVPSAEDLPPRRVEWQVDPNRCALLVHDMQEHFVRPYDRHAEPMSSTLASIGRLVAAARAAGVPVVYTAQPAHQTTEQRGLLTDFWGPGIGHDEAAARIVSDLAPEAGDTVLTKWRYDAFARTDLADRLREWGRDQLVVTGVFTHIGVLATTSRAFMDDIQAFLPADATADFSRDEQDMALDYVAGRCGVVTTTADVLRVWQPEGDVLPRDEDAVIRQVAGLLGLDASELDADTDLVAAGLDSVRAMQLATEWSDAGAEIGYMDIVMDPTPRGVLRLLRQGALA